MFPIILLDHFIVIRTPAELLAFTLFLMFWAFSIYTGLRCLFCSRQGRLASILALFMPFAAWYAISLFFMGSRFLNVTWLEWTGRMIRLSPVETLLMLIMILAALLLPWICLHDSRKFRKVRKPRAYSSCDDHPTLS